MNFMTYYPSTGYVLSLSGFVLRATGSLVAHAGSLDISLRSQTARPLAPPASVTHISHALAAKFFRHHLQHPDLHIQTHF